MKIDKLYLLAALLGLFVGSTSYAIAQPGSLYDLQVFELNAAHPTEVCVKFKDDTGTVVPDEQTCPFNCVYVDLSIAGGRWMINALSVRQMAALPVKQVDYLAAGGTCLASRVVTREPAQ